MEWLWEFLMSFPKGIWEAIKDAPYLLIITMVAITGIAFGLTKLK